MPSYVEIAEKAARAGGDVLRQWLGRFSVREKGPSDLVTEADLAAQEAVASILLAAFPDHGFVGEEGGRRDNLESPFRWYVDPLDGTTNYVHRIPHYCTSIALEHAGELIAAAVYDPVLDECYTAAAGEGAWLNGQPMRTSAATDLSQAIVAVGFPARVPRGSFYITDFSEVLVRTRGVRRTGSAALNLCYVACGRFDAYWAKETNAWDVAAGALLVRAAGGIVTALDGSKFHAADPRLISACTPELHRALFEIDGVK
jgi:myo-inositol-1(or 4)-monophosphatase